MTQRDALLRAVCANPADDLPRLVYADWLEENGEPEEAAFIRAQVAGKDGRAEFDAFCQCHQSESPGLSHLLEHLNESGGPSVVYRRGFVAEVRYSLRTWDEHTAALVGSNPIEAVTLTDREPLVALSGRFLWVTYFDTNDPLDIHPAEATYFIPLAWTRAEHGGGLGDFATREEAIAALSLRAVNVERRRQGLPLLTAPTSVVPATEAVPT